VCEENICPLERSENSGSISCHSCENDGRFKISEVDERAKSEKERDEYV